MCHTRLPRQRPERQGRQLRWKMRWSKATALADLAGLTRCLSLLGHLLAEEVPERERLRGLWSLLPCRKQQLLRKLLTHTAPRAPCWRSQVRNHPDSDFELHCWCLDPRRVETLRDLSSVQSMGVAKPAVHRPPPRHRSSCWPTAAQQRSRPATRSVGTEGGGETSVAARRQHLKPSRRWCTSQPELLEGIPKSQERLQHSQQAKEWMGQEHCKSSRRPSWKPCRLPSASLPPSSGAWSHPAPPSKRDFLLASLLSVSATPSWQRLFFGFLFSI